MFGFVELVEKWPVELVEKIASFKTKTKQFHTQV
jgi:hypothetical protein